MSGAVTTLSDFADPRQGPTNDFPRFFRPHFNSLTIDNDGTIFVVDGLLGTDFHGALLSIDAVTGMRTILSDFGDSQQGPEGTRPGGSAVEPTGNLLVEDSGRGVIFRVERIGGTRTIVSEFAFTQPSDPLLAGRSLGIEVSGTAVAGAARVNSVLGALIRVDLSTGAQTVFSDFDSPAQGPSGTPGQLAIEFSGNVLVTSGDTLFLLRVDPVTGSREVLSDLSNPGQGPTGRPLSIAVEESGDILVNVVGSAGGVLVRVDPFTGQRTRFIDISPEDLAVVPMPLLNDLISMPAMITAFSPDPVPEGPSGTFTIRATFLNVSSVPIRSGFFRVIELSGGNVLLNADRQPGATGARLTPNAGADDVLSPGESIDVEFVIALASRERFTFLVDYRGVAE